MPRLPEVQNCAAIARHLNRSMDYLNLTNGTAFDVITVECAGAPFSHAANDYACFKDLIGKYGVYVFQDKTTNEVLYVGEAYKQDLKTRVKQNYTENDTGGTFRRNFCDVEHKSFHDFKNLLSGSSLKAISIVTSSMVLIGAIEAILIAALKPKYNK